MLDMIISNIISITNAYICYKFFVFKTRGNYIKEYLRFYLVYGIAFALNILLLPLFVRYLKIHPLVAQAIVTLFTIIISYWGHRHFSFRLSSETLENIMVKQDED
jgi:putative flippase GtrA